MLSDLYYSLNAVLPIFIVALVGYILRCTHLLSEDFVKCADKLVFRVMLPCLLFTKVAYMDKTSVTGDDFKLVVFCLCAVVCLTACLCLFVPAFLKDNGKRGAFIQGVFRSNVAFLGVPFALNLFGDEGGRLAAILLATVVPLYNVIAVVVLCVYEPVKGKTSPLKSLGKVLFGILKNPLIIAIVAAVPFCIYGIKLPSFAAKSIDYFAGASTTLALITIGASFRFSDLKGRIGLAVAASIMKTVVVPAAFLSLAHYVFGFSGTRLGLVMIVFGTPTAISSYIMARNMNSDYKLANQIVLLTTLCSVLTVFGWSFLLRTMNLI